MAGINNKQVSSRLNELIQDLKFRSVRSFALAVDIDPSHFSKVFKGERSISDEIAKNINQKFNISEAWLVYGRGEKYMRPDHTNKKPAAVKNFTEDLDIIIGRQQERLMLLEAAMEVFAEKIAEIKHDSDDSSVSSNLNDLENAIKERYRMRFDELKTKP